MQWEIPRGFPLKVEKKGLFLILILALLFSLAACESELTQGMPRPTMKPPTEPPTPTPDPYRGNHSSWLERQMDDSFVWNGGWGRSWLISTKLELADTPATGEREAWLRERERGSDWSVEYRDRPEGGLSPRRNGRYRRRNLRIR